MVKDKKYNNQGMVDFAKAWGSVCSSRNCEECSVDIIKGADISCPEFARQFPKKFVSLILDEYEGGITYAHEYVLRFPNCKMTAEDFVALGMQTVRMTLYRMRNQNPASHSMMKTSEYHIRG